MVLKKHIEILNMITGNLSCQILNTALTSTTAEQAVAFLRLRLLEEPEALMGKYVLNVSLDDVMNSWTDEEYCSLINTAEMALPNSRQLSFRMREEGYPRAEKINPRVFFDKMLEACQEEEFSHYFLCSNEAEKEGLLASLREKYPTLKVAGARVIGNENPAPFIKESGAKVVWCAANGKQQALISSRLAAETKTLVIGIGYGIDNWLKGGKTEITNRITLPYISMNIKYRLKTGKKSFICAISWLPALVILCVIFFLSAQRGADSLETSRTVAGGVIQLSFFRITFDLTDEAAWLESLNSLVRTAAHIMEYMALSLSLGFAITVNGISAKIRFIITCFLGMAVAVLDELFQVFVPDRYGDLQDIVCDWFGIIFVALLIYALDRKRHGKKVRLYEGTDRRKFLNIQIDDVTFDEAIDLIDQLAGSQGRHYVVTPNSDHVIKMEKDTLFRQILEEADLILTDGTPLMWIADSLGYPIREKIPGADCLPRVCERATKTGKTLFFLGAKEGVAKIAAERLEKKYPGLKVIGTYSPPLGFEKNPEEIKRTIEKVNEKSADILVVALGSPKQEKFIYENKEKLNFHVALPFGAALDFEAENIKRAPRWMRDAGLEWLFRFLQEPGRMFHRYFIDDMKIFYLAWKYRKEMQKINTETK